MIRSTGLHGRPKQGSRRKRSATMRKVTGAFFLLRPYITSGYMLGKHTQAGHTHVQPDVGLRGAGGRLLPQEEQVAGEELQLWLVRLGVLDDLSGGRPRTRLRSLAEQSKSFLCLFLYCVKTLMFSVALLGRMWMKQTAQRDAKQMLTFISLSCVNK